MVRLPRRIGLVLISVFTLPIIACETATPPPAPAQQAPGQSVAPSKDKLERLPDIKP